MDSPLRLDSLPAAEARGILEQCCGSARWVEGMLGRRPFGSPEALRRAAREEWFGLDEAEWRRAFSHHPAIGDREALRTRFARTRDLSVREQAGAADASDAVLEALADGNREYVERFGYIFIVCASGLTAGEMLARLRARLANDPPTEIRTAAEEHARITDLRLRTLT